MFDRPTKTYPETAFTTPKYGIQPAYSCLIGTAILFCLYLTSLHSYILFHYLAEMFSIFVSFAIFTFAWNTFGFVRSGYLILLGVAYLFIGLFDVLHTLSYKGMGVLGNNDPNLPTQLWIIARYLESTSLFIAPFYLNKRLRPFIVLLLFALASTVLLGSLFPVNWFPDCYVTGVGLTDFKKISEHIICAILAAAGLGLYHHREAMGKTMYRLMMASIGFTILSELAFTLYVSVYGLSNLVGHLSKIISYYLVYRAIVAHGLLAPYKTMFRELFESKRAIAKYSHELEDKVTQRTQALNDSNLELKSLSAQLLKAQEGERQRIAQELHDGLGQALSAIKLFLENSIFNLKDRLSPSDLEGIKNIVPMTKMAIDEMRTILMGLRPRILDENGIISTIQWQCREFESMHPQIKIDKNLQLTELEIPVEIKTVIFRLLQEALHNVAKHSCARTVNVFLGWRSDNIFFQIADDGCGFELSRLREKLITHNGIGLASMRERARLSGARFEIDSNPGKGTKIHVCWPIEKLAEISQVN